MMISELARHASNLAPLYEYGAAKEGGSKSQLNPQLAFPYSTNSHPFRPVEGKRGQRKRKKKLGSNPGSLVPVVPIAEEERGLELRPHTLPFPLSVKRCYWNE